MSLVAGIGMGIPFGGAVPAGPAAISNLIAWFEASQGINLNGADVSQWDDLSGNGNHLIQGTPANQPVFQATDANFNNQPSVQFEDFNSEFMKTAPFAGGDISQPNTIVVVGRFINVSGSPAISKALFDGLTATKRNHFRYKNLEYRMIAGTTLQHTPIIGGTTSPAIFVFQFDGSNSKLIYNRAGVTTIDVGDVGSEVMDGLTLSAHYSAPSGTHTDAEFPEIIIYNKRLIDAEINTLGEYLAPKYGFTWVEVKSCEFQDVSNYTLQDGTYFEFN